MSRHLLYEILDVSRDADAATIKEAYRELAREYHPDRNPGNPDAEEQFQCVRAAFDVLSDAERRRRYDRLGFAALEGLEVEDFDEAPRPGEGRDGSVGGVFSDVLDGEDPFDTSHFDGVGGFDDGDGEPGEAEGDGAIEAKQGADIVREIEVDFLEAIRGDEVETEIDGELVRVPLAAGTCDGDRLRVPGRGEPPPADDGDPGDLLLDVRVADHPDIRREGLDLYVDLPVTVAEAILGATVRWPTPVGEVELEIPEGVDSGTKLRLARRGIDSKDGRGDLYAVVRIRTPDVVDADAEEAAEVLGESYSQSPRDGLEQSRGES